MQTDVIFGAIVTEKVLQILETGIIVSQLIALSLFPLGVHYLRKEMSEKYKFFEAMRSFDVRQSSCRESFDDEFIDAAISAWYGSVDEFNNHVRTNVLGRLEALRGAAQLPFRYATFACFPVFCNYIDGMAGAIYGRQ